MAKCNDCELCTQGLLGALHKATSGGPPALSTLPAAAAAPFKQKCGRCLHTLAEHQAFKVQIAVLVAQQATAQVASPAPVPQAPPSPPRSHCEHCGATFPEADRCPECGARAVAIQVPVAPAFSLPPPSSVTPAPSAAAKVAAFVVAPGALLATSAAALSKGDVPWHKRLIVVIPALVFFAPAGIALAWIHRLWRQRTRILVSIASAAFFSWAIVASQLDKRDKAKADKAAVAAKEKEALNRTREEATEQPRRAADEAKAKGDTEALAQVPPPTEIKTPPTPDAAVPPTPPKPEEIAKTLCGRAAFTSFKGGVLACVIEEDAFGDDGLRDYVIDGHTELADLAKGFDTLPELKSITILEFAIIVDERGNSKKVKVAEFKLSRATAKKINWDNVLWKNIPKVIDDSWMKSGVDYLIDG